MLIIILFSLLLSFTSPALSSSAPGSLGISRAESIWRRVTAKDEEFSVLMPTVPSGYVDLVTDRSGKRRLERIYSSYSEGSVYLVVSYDMDSVKDTLESFEAHHLYQGEITFERDITLDSFHGKQYKLKLGEVTGTLQIHVTKKHGYAVAIIQAVDDVPLAQYFLSSFSIVANDAGLQRDATQGPPVKHASTIPQTDPAEAPVSSKNVTRKAIVVSKPEPSYSDEARQAGITGTVVIRAVLSSSGEVTNMNVVRGLPKGLTEHAMAAARHLKFIPAIKDGRFVSYYVQLEYNFGLY